MPSILTPTKPMHLSGLLPLFMHLLTSYTEEVIVHIQNISQYKTLNSNAGKLKKIKHSTEVEP